MKRTLIFAAIGLLSISVRAGRPLLTDDSGTVSPGQAEVEAGALYIFGDEARHADALAGLAMGVTPTLEAGAGFGAQWEQRRMEDGSHDRFADCSDLTLGLKWQGISSGPGELTLALAPAIKLPTANEEKNGSGEVDFDLTGIASLPLGSQAGIHLNGGYSWLGDGKENHSDVAHIGVALDYEIIPAWQWVGELYFSQDAETHEPWNIYAGTGLRWFALECLTVDAAGGAIVHGDSPDWSATLGLTWTIDWHNEGSK